MTELLANLTTVAGQVATLFIMMGVGFALKKLKRITVDAQKQIMFILLYVVSPCLIVNAMQVERSAAAAKSMLLTALGCLIYFVITVVISRFFFKKREPDTRDVLQFGTIYPNCAFMGFPLIRAVLGDGAMVYASVFLIIFQLVHWTHGVVLMGGRKSASVRAVLINPGTFGFIVGLLFFALNVKMPWPLGNAVSFVAEINTPMAMFVIGAQMADTEILKLFRKRDLYGVSAVKLLLFPALTALALFPLGLPPMVYCVVVILCAAPSAGVTAMFAQRYERDEATAASAVSLTTLLSILTLPVFAAVAKFVSG
ncbi:MAG: AEC family transporter [Oscillospiraceae bacterium]|jgi:predicted permease|nr:AEC family transporter [Oscillospiraceae bacterium]